MAACCPSLSSSSSSGSVASIANDHEEAMQNRLEQMRRERQSELKSIGRLVADAVSTAEPGSEPQAALRRLLDRQQAPQSQQAPPVATTEILVEVRSLSELRPVSRILQSSAFRTELESLVRFTLSPRQVRPEPQRQRPQPQETDQQPQPNQSSSPAESLTELRRRRHEELVQDISELLHSQLVTGGLDGQFRARLERELRGRAEVLPDSGQRAIDAVRRLPPSGIQRNDFSHLGIWLGASGGEDLNSASSVAGDDVLSVVSVPIAGAAAAAAVATSASSAAVSRQLHSVQRELTDLRRTVRLLLGNQLETQRMIRQEVSAALAGRTAPPAPQAIWTSPPGACLICLTGRADTVMYRCGHLCLCNMCTARMRESAPEGRMACPVCRAPVVDTLRVFSAGAAPDGAEN